MSPSPDTGQWTVDTHCSVQLLWVQCKHEVIILIIVWHMDCITTSAVTRTHNFCTSCQESCCKQYILCTLSGAEFTSPSRILLVIVALAPRCMFCVSGGHPGP